MASKRTTKQQRLAAEKAALKQRLEDIARGAIGWIDDPAFFDDGDYTLFGEIDAKSFGDFLAGMTAAWDLRNDDTYLSMRNILSPIAFDLWDKPWPVVIDNLYVRGFRA